MRETDIDQLAALARLAVHNLPPIERPDHFTFVQAMRKALKAHQRALKKIARKGDIESRLIAGLALSRRIR